MSLQCNCEGLSAVSAGEKVAMSRTAWDPLGLRERDPEDHHHLQSLRSVWTEKLMATERRKIPLDMLKTSLMEDAGLSEPSPV